MKFKVGDQVQIRMDKVNNEHKKYIDIYTIKEIKKNFKGIYLYKLKVFQIGEQKI